MLSTLQLAPVPASNGVADLRNALDYMHAHSSFGGVNLVNGTAAVQRRTWSARSSAARPTA